VVLGFIPGAFFGEIDWNTANLFDEHSKKRKKYMS
jgi:hypothetical protein